MRKRGLFVFLLIFFVTGCSSIKKTESKIAINYDVAELTNQNYEEVVENLKKNGFTEIRVEKIEDLVTGWLTKDGSVGTVIINGVPDFSKGDKFEKNAEVKVSYHTFKTKESSEIIASSSEEIELALEVSVEIFDDKAILTGLTNPNAKVTIGKGILGDSTQADSTGKFILEESLIPPVEKNITVQTKLNGHKKSISVKITPTEEAVKKYEEELIAKEEEKKIEKAKKEALEEENNKIITVENTPEFAKIVTSHDEHEEYRIFAKEYENRTIEFDGNIAFLERHENNNTRFNFLIYYGDYSQDGSGTSGPAFLFKDKTISRLNFPEKLNSLQEGQNLRIKAKIISYNYDQGLFFLDPVETTLR